MSTIFENNLVPDSFLSTKEASSISGYHADYLGRLCRSGKIIGTRVGRTWFIDRLSLETFIVDQKKRKQELASETARMREKEYRYATTSPAVQRALSALDSNAKKVADHVKSTVPPLRFSPTVRPLPQSVFALAITLFVLAGSAYASTTSVLQKALTAAPTAAATLAYAVRTHDNEHAAFRVTESEAIPNEHSKIIAVPNAQLLSRQFAFVTGAHSNTLAETAAEHARTTLAMLASTERGRARLERTVYASTHPREVLAYAAINSARAYVEVGTQGLAAAETTGDMYMDVIQEAGDQSLAAAAVARDTAFILPRVRDDLLAYYVRGIEGWVDGTPRVLGASVRSVYVIGDIAGTVASAFPKGIVETKDTLAQAWVTHTMHIAEETVAREVAFGTSINALASKGGDLYLGSIQSSGDRLASAYGAGESFISHAATLPDDIENHMLGAVGVLAAQFDTSNDTATESSSTSENANTALTSGQTDATSSSISASILSLLPVSWQHTVQRIFYSTGHAFAMLFHSSATLLGISMPETQLTIIPFDGTTTITLPGSPPASGSSVASLQPSDTDIETQPSSDTRTNTVWNIVNNYVATTVFDAAFTNAVLAVTRPFITSSIEAALRNRSSGSSSSGNSGGSSGGVSSDGATLTNVDIQSGNATLSSLSADSVQATNATFTNSTSTNSFANTLSANTLTLAGSLRDNSGSSGSNGYVLQSTGSGVAWVATSSLGITTGTSSGSGGSGTVTSVNASGGTTGLSFSGGPVTATGTLTLAGTLGIANGGTNATTQTTNGVAYYDGTRITTGSGLTYNGTTFTTTNATFTNSTSTNLFATTLGATSGIINSFTSTNATSTNLFTTNLSTNNLSLGGSTFTSLLGSGLSNIGGALTVSTSSFALDTNYFKQGGNTFGTAAILGTTDANPLTFITNGSEKARFDAAGNLLVGTTSPLARLTVGGSAVVSGGVTSGSLTTGAATVNSLSIGSLSGFLKATAGAVSTALIDLSTDVTSTLASTHGGTGFASYTTGDILYADNSGQLARLPIGAPGQVLKIQAGLPAWGLDQTSGGGGGGGIFATSTGIIYPTDTSLTLLVGTNATSTNNSIFEVNGNSYFSGNVGIGSTSPSQKLSVTGNGAFSGNVVAGGNVVVGGSFTLGGSTFNTLLGSGLSNVGGALTVSTSTLGFDTTYFKQGGNAFGTVATLGTTDATSLRFVTGGVERGRFDNTTGNFGIGTTTPFRSLTVAGQGYFNNTLTLGSTTGNGVLNGENSLLIQRAGVNRLSLFSAITSLGDNINQNALNIVGGNIGLATTSPSARLEVYGVGATDLFALSSSTGARLVTVTSAGNVGIGTTTPYQKLTVVGNLAVTGAYYDSTASPGILGQILSSTGTGAQWIATSSLGFTNGTVTSVNASGGTTGLSFSGGPVTATGTLTLAGTLGIANGGTNATTQTTNGVAYYDGTRITTGSGLTYNGTTFTTTNATFTSATSTNLAASNFTLGGSTFTSLLGTGLSNVGGALTVSTSTLGFDTTYFKQGGNAFGGAAVLGTTDANPLTFITNGSEKGRFDTAGNFGIGTNAPDAWLTVASTSGAAFGAPQAGTLLHIVSNGSLNARVAIDTYNSTSANGSIVQGRRGRGTSDSPLAATTDDILVAFGGDGYGSTAFHNISVGAFTIRAEGPFTDTSAPTYLTFSTTPTGTISALERMRITSDGNVGIGTSTPNALLVLSGATGERIKTTTNTATALAIENAIGTTTFQVSTIDSTSSIFSVATSTGASYLEVLANGNVGIGTPTPNALLTVAGTGLYSGTLGVGITPTVAKFEVKGTTTDATAAALSVWDASNSSLLYVRNDGRIGIGTTTPSTLLEIAGSYGSAGQLIVGSIGNAGGIAFRRGTDGNTTGTIGYTGGSSSGILYLKNTTGNGSVQIDSNMSSTGGIIFSNNGSEIARVASNGIGIGTSTPSTALSVAGQISVSPGSAGAPAIASFAFPTRGIFFDSSGNTIISSPLLSLTGTNAPSLLNINTSLTVPVIIPNKVITTTGIGGDTSGNLALIASSTTGLVVSASNGFVGIGTTTPNRLLSVSGSSGSTVVAEFANTNATANNGVLVDVRSYGGQDAAIRYISTGASGWTSGYDSSTGNYSVALGNNYLSQLGANRFFNISAAGNVGIGTTSPAARLDVLGNANITATNANAFTVGVAGQANPAFQVNTSSSTSATGLQITSSGAGGGVTLNAISSGTNENITLGAKGQGTVILAVNGSARVQVGSSNFSVAQTFNSFVTNASTNIGARFLVTGAADTTLTANNEAANTYFNMGQIRQHATGNIALQRDFRITPSTHSFVGASTITDTAAFAVDGPPIGGTNATLTNAHGIYVSTSTVTNVTNSYGLTVNTASGATNNYAAAFLGGNVGIGTTTPFRSLTVAGQGYFNNTLTLGSTTGNGVLNGENSLLIQRAGVNRLSLFSAITSLGDNINQNALNIVGGNIGLATTSPSARLEVYGVGATDLFALSSSTGARLVTVTSAGNVGIGTSTPTAQFHTTGTVRFSNFGAGTLTTDANGNVTAASDERLKNVNGAFSRGLADLEKLNPILYHWNKLSGLDQVTQYAGFSAQNVQGAIPEAIDTDPRGYLSLQDRPILAASVNAIKELAGRTDLLSVSTTSLAVRVATLESAAQEVPLPHALTATQITAESLAIAHGVSAGTLTVQSVNADGTVSAARYIVPANTIVFANGSSTMYAALPDEVLVANNSVDVYKLASYTLASAQALASRTDLLDTRIDAIDARVNALEAGAASSSTGTSTNSTLSLAASTIKDALASLGIMIKHGFLALDTLMTRQLVFSSDDDGTSSAGSVTIPAGETFVTVTNTLVLTSSKVFITFTSPVDGSWYLSEKKQGEFIVKLSSAQNQETSFDYFLIQTDGASADNQTASVGTVPPPSPSTSSSSDEEDSSTPEPPDTTPTVTLNGAAAIALAQGASWNDPGATANDPTDGDISSSITTSGSVDTNTPGLYTITYRVTNATGGHAEVSRVVTVSAPSTGEGSGSDSPTPPSGSDTGSGESQSTPAPAGDSAPTS